MTAGGDPPQRVLDASALLAVLFREVGFDAVPLEGSAVSAVNWSEVVQVATRREADVAGLGDALAAEGTVVVPFTAVHAEAAAALWPATRARGSVARGPCVPGAGACLRRAGPHGGSGWIGVATKVEVVVVR